MDLMVFTTGGHRKYLTSKELSCFAETARCAPLDVQTFCLTIAHTGCRISEALALTADNIDFEAQTLIIKCLKKRGKIVYRAIPLPRGLLDQLRSLIEQIGDSSARLWPWSRMTGYRRICEVMEEAGIAGEHASPKGLRHGFAVQAIQANVPLTLVQRWLGHANLKTTAIYTAAMGAEERKLAERMWGEEEAADSNTSRAPATARPIPAVTVRCGSVAQDVTLHVRPNYRSQYSRLYCDGGPARRHRQADGNWRVAQKIAVKPFARLRAVTLLAKG
ncbi:tyrosine-type recombinase/integrase [Sphingomonas sp. ATCC 31555]|uniref:tyrosine-type recombinase/integrase n=1 Tax=Sphingomonas sp. ATCC 31555 TaxID=194867 RepID=UPI0003117851|nr:site-specific integrase [Sphingomonas sp. ATCC 31555]